VSVISLTRCAAHAQLKQALISLQFCAAHVLTQALISLTRCAAHAGNAAAAHEHNEPADAARLQDRGNGGGAKVSRELAEGDAHVSLHELERHACSASPHPALAITYEGAEGAEDDAGKLAVWTLLVQKYFCY
jgi:hypothetical protein